MPRLFSRYTCLALFHCNGNCLRARCRYSASFAGFQSGYCLDLIFVPDRLHKGGFREERLIHEIFFRLRSDSFSGLRLSFFFDVLFRRRLSKSGFCKRQLFSDFYILYIHCYTFSILLHVKVTGAVPLSH